MKRLITALLLTSCATLAAAETIAVYKDASCGCCGKWVEHVRAAGFEARVVDTPKMDAIKARFGVPAQMRSCHTAVVGGYVIEGHVPASDIRALLAKKPRVAGLAAPGMPPGSPGMDIPNSPGYTVFAFGRDGTATPFARH